MVDLVAMSLALASAMSSALAQNVASISIAPQPTQGASGIISPAFAGFGVEPSNLFSFTGGSQNNDLTTNLLKNLASYTGVPPHIRLGGNTQDYMIYDGSMDQYLVKMNPHSVGQGAYATDRLIVGPRYFEAANRAFPRSTPITFGLNLAYSEADYLDRITTMAAQSLDRMTNVNVVSFEIGNEPDLYFNNGFRTSWSGRQYTQQWLNRANTVWERVLRPRNIGSNFFEPGATASTIGTDFQIDVLSAFGITQTANDSSAPYIAQWNQHDYYYYIGVSKYAITQADFMTLSNTNVQFTAWAGQIQQAATTGFPYALREMGVVGPIGLDGITNVFGAALWTLNFLMYAATLNITAVGMHMTDDSNASAWQPIEIYGNKPYVRPNYYAFAAFDQAIGPTCQARIGGYIFDTPAAYNGRAAAYSIYQDNTLATIVLINSNPANISDTKGTLTFSLGLDTQFAGKTIYLALLTNTGADAMHGTTFNGISFEQSGNGTPTQVSSDQHTVTVGKDGSVNIDVRDSQAVIANIGSPVGRRQPNASACSAITQSRPDARSSPTSTAKSGSNGSGTFPSPSSTNPAPPPGSQGPAAPSGGIRLSSRSILTLIAAFTSGFVILCML